MLSVTVLTSTTDVAYYYILLMFCVCRVLLKMSPRAYFNLQAQKSKHCWCQKYHVGKTSVSRTIVIDILFLGELESEITLTKKGKVMFLVFSCPYVETCSTHSSVKEHLLSQIMALNLTGEVSTHVPYGLQLVCWSHILCVSRINSMEDCKFQSCSSSLIHRSRLRFVCHLCRLPA